MTKKKLDRLSLMGDNSITAAQTIRSYVAANGRCPFEDWLGGLRDPAAKAAVLTRIDRLRFGNFGDFRSVGRGVFELRIHRGPGYRVYFGLAAGRVVLLLGGGDKSTQRRDIERCRRLWREYENG
jgi:putative addiction module killer protein